MDKKETIDSLKKVKLVIGNGYDLHCGLQSSYKDFFMRDEAKNSYFINWINEFKNKAITFVDSTKYNHNDFWVEFKNLDKTNIWDFFFYIKTKIKNPNNQKEWLWCEIESVMLDSLRDNADRGYYNSTFNWSLVYMAINEGLSANVNNWEVLVLAGVILKMRNFKKFDNKDEFYDFLLNELHAFEAEFGEFIAKKRHYFDGFIVHNNLPFERNSQITLSHLCKKENLVSIDSFNYDNIGDESLDHIFHNINGDVSNPIFGVDSTLCNASDPRFVFTKTNRRMELEMVSYDAKLDMEFENVIVYGHSLSVSDYSYFFPLLDKLEISNFTSNKKIVFAYTVYDVDKEYQIRKTNRLNIQKLFEAYAKYKSMSEPTRLLDSLTTQNRVITYEIPSLQIPKNTFF